ncbi:hypothetical protein RUM43_002759 [Polyplax serrata]|uniref:SOWAHA-C winged helix-turn-helix domain-containing protein n=1 Tax=Polyplax serrata TaxID=468196 RepID=A0AAN8S524_POLSC
MSGPTELSLEAVRDFIILNGGKVRNHDLVKHFKKFLTKPQNRDDARNYFKEIVNQVAVIRTEGDEKYLILKRRFRPPGMEDCLSPTTAPPTPSPSLSVDSPSRSGTSHRQPPPYRAPPPPSVTPTKSNPGSPVSPLPGPMPSFQKSQTTTAGAHQEESPVVPARRKNSSEKAKKEQQHHTVITIPHKTSAPDVADGPEPDDKKISVKERMQKFNRMASESDLPRMPVNNYKKKVEREDDDVSSVTSMDPKRREWLLNAAKGEYQVLAKLAAECPRLVRTKVKPVYTNNFDELKRSDKVSCDYYF